MSWGMSRRRRNLYPAPPLVFALPRPSQHLTEDEAVAIAIAARSLGELHALFWDDDVEPVERERKRGPYRRRGAHGQGE